MRWNSRSWIPPYRSMHIQTRFLWLPKEIQGVTRWLERATWIGRVITLQSTRTHEDVDWQWTDERWLDSEAEIAEAKCKHAEQLKRWDDWKASRHT